MLAQLQKRLEEQEVKATRKCEKSVLERDASIRVQNQLLTQVEVLRRAQTRSIDKESCTYPLRSRTANTAYAGGSRRRHRSVSPHHEECSDESEPSKLTKTSRVKDLVEMVRKRIHEDTTTLWRLRIVHPVSFEFSSFRRNHVLWIPEAVRDTELRVIHRSNRSRLAPSILSGQDCDPLSRRQSHVLDVSLQSQGHGLRLVLLFLVTVFSKL